MSIKKKVVIIGGGTGIYPTLQGLKKYKDIRITAIVSMTDSGGSTGRLRDEFGLLPVGDVRMALAALATDIDEHGELLRELFLHRFNRGEGLHGHNFGNVLLMALTDILGTEEMAISTASRILRIRGKVVPVTTDNVSLHAQYDDESTCTGEHVIDEPPEECAHKHITQLSTIPVAHISSSAKEAIQQADIVVLGPGSFYTSLLANCIIEGVAEEIKNTPALFVYMANLMTSCGQTFAMTVSDHVKEVQRYTGRMPDTVVVNTGKIADELLERYAHQQQFPVIDDTSSLTCNVVHADILDGTMILHKPGDVLKRSLVRGDAEKTAEVLVQLLP